MQIKLVTVDSRVLEIQYTHLSPEGFDRACNALNDLSMT